MKRSQGAPNEISLSDLMTVGQLAAAYPQVLTVDRLRWHLRQRDTNGLACCCVRLGRRLLIAKPRFEKWLASRVEAA